MVLRLHDRILKKTMYLVRPIEKFTCVPRGLRTASNELRPYLVWPPGTLKV